MAISEIDIKLLWGRAGATCSKPDCNQDLTALIASGNYIVGEMAHIIGRQPTARRGNAGGGADTYDNLILLCPTHHTHIDKAPEGTFPPEMLHEWKRKHEEMISRAGSGASLEYFDQLKGEVSHLLSSNRAIFKAFGPSSENAVENPSSNLFSVWKLRRIDRIIPNNRKILNLLDKNIGLIPASLIECVEKFRIHAEAYEQHVIHRLDSYPLFPTEFESAFKL